MMSLRRADTAMMTSRINAPPIQADPTIPTLRRASEANEIPSSGAPSRNNETPRLAPELIPST